MTDEEIDAMTDEVLAQALSQNQRALDENERKLAYSQGRMHATIDQLANEPEHLDLLRHLAWARTGMNFSIKDGRVRGAPEGWPEGIAETDFVAEWSAQYRQNEPTGERQVEQQQSSPAISRFKKLLG